MSVYFLRRGKASVLDAIFANNSWEAIIAACQSGRVPDSWVVGNSKTMTIGGTNYQIDIIGKNHDTYAAGGTAPLTFQLHDCYENSNSMNSSSSSIWEKSKMRNKHLPAILALMPSEVQAAIREVNKKTAYSVDNSTIYTYAEKLFLLSEIEVFGSVTYSKIGEGNQYNYYAKGNSKIKKKVNSIDTNWWLRSPCTEASSNRFCLVKSDGTADYYYYDGNRGIAFAFCF